MNLVPLQSLCRVDRLGCPGTTENSCNFLKYPTSEKTVNLGFSMYFLEQKMLIMHRDPPPPWTLYCLYIVLGVYIDLL